MTEQQLFAVAAGYALAALVGLVVLALHWADQRDSKRRAAARRRSSDSSHDAA